MQSHLRYSTKEAVTPHGWDLRHPGTTEQPYKEEHTSFSAQTPLIFFPSSFFRRKTGMIYFTRITSRAEKKFLISN